MNDAYTMQFILIFLFVCSGYLFLLQYALNHSSYSQRNIPVAILLFIIFFCVIGALGLILFTVLGVEYVLPLCTLSTIAGIIYATCKWLLPSYPKNKSLFLIFIFYVLLLGYITLFSRHDRGNSTILLQFDTISALISSRSFSHASHFFQNIALFIPLGFLLPPLCPQQHHKWLIIFACGLLTTSLIESIQFLFHLGLVDVEDLVANFGGAMLGYGLYCICNKLQLFDKTRK